MTPQAKKTKHTVKPILGFGKVGVAASIVAAALVIVLVTGYDLRLQLLRLISFFLGVDAMMRILAITWVSYYVALSSPSFGPIGLLYALPALHIYPQRVAMWRWAIVLLWGVFGPLLFTPLTAVSLNFVSWLALPFLGYMAALHFASISMYLISSGCLWIATRSKLVLSASLAAVALAALYEIGVLHQAQRLAILYAWHALLAGSLLTWSIRARLASRDYPHCIGCGYDLRGLPDDCVCPECGVNSAAHVRTPPLSTRRAG